MGAMSKHQEVGCKLDILLAFRAEAVRVEPLGILVPLHAGCPHRGHHQAALGCCVVLCQGEVLLDQVRDHGCRGLEAQHLLDHLACVGHLVELLAGEGRIQVGPQPLLLRTHLCKHFRVLCHLCDGPHQGRGAGVLAGEEEVHHGVRHLVIGGVPRGGHTLCLRLLHVSENLLRPEIKQTLRLVACCHACLTATGSLGQHFDDEHAALVALPYACPREADG
mmetsp:Transcript_22161/g.37867  ORF Transcript_22161/g.37867 Transcript_22161/m.37867 type:complete len:221 (-) Transcript_22161:807-1469(-)